MNKKTQRYLSDMARTINPYTWEFVADNQLRFNSNTLPSPPPSVDMFLKTMKKRCPVNEYADPTYTRLNRMIADYEQVSPSCVTITNSGDEAIDILAKTFLNPGDVFITSPPTYEMFAIQSEINRGVHVAVPLKTADFSINKNGVITTARRKQAKMIFICNPNNPTGSVTPLDDIETIIRETPGMVVVDEVYREFYGITATPLLKRYGNLVILRSFSKFAALAGARIGYLIANKPLTKTLNSIRFPMGVSYLSSLLAEYVLTYDRKWMNEQITMIQQERQRLTDRLTQLGFFVYPSQANFLLVKIGNRAREIFDTLKEKGVCIRDRSYKPFLSGCVRITIRSTKENDQLIAALGSIIRRKHYDRLF